MVNYIRGWIDDKGTYLMIYERIESKCVYYILVLERFKAKMQVKGIKKHK